MENESHTQPEPLEPPIQHKISPAAAAALEQIDQAKAYEEVDEAIKGLNYVIGLSRLVPGTNAWKDSRIVRHVGASRHIDIFNRRAKGTFSALTKTSSSPKHVIAPERPAYSPKHSTVPEQAIDASLSTDELESALIDIHGDIITSDIERAIHSHRKAAGMGAYILSFLPESFGSVRSREASMLRSARQAAIVGAANSRAKQLETHSYAPVTDIDQEQRFMEQARLTMKPKDYKELVNKSKYLKNYRRIHPSKKNIN